MAETLVVVEPPTRKDPPEGGDRPPDAAELDATRELVRLARDRGVALTGPNGLLKVLTKTVLETAQEEEIAEHLGYDKQDPAGRNHGNSRKQHPAQDGADRDSTFTPQIVRKRQRRLSDVDEVVLSLYAKGLTTEEISAHFGDVYGASVSKETVSRITERVIFAPSSTARQIEPATPSER